MRSIFVVVAMASSTLALALQGCGDDTAGTSATSSSASGAGGHGGQTGQGGQGGQIGQGGQGGGAECGDAPILGPQAPPSAECAACVAKSCCSERKACSDDPQCMAFRACVEPCDPLDANCAAACQASNPPPPTSGALAACRNTNCAAVCANMSCFGKVDLSKPPAMAQYTVPLTVLDLQSSSPVAGAQVRVCSKNDADCQAPLSTQMTDAKGTVMLTMPSAPEGYSAYIEVTGAGLVPQLAYKTMVNTSIELVQAWTFKAISQSTLSLLAGAAGVSLDPARGQLALTTYDCSAFRLPDVSVDASTKDNSSTTLYLIGGAPLTSATSTDTSGVGIITNVPAGPTTYTMTYAPTNTQIGKGTVHIRPGAFTAVFSLPTP